MKCCKSVGLPLIASLILLTGFKRNIGQQNISSKKSTDRYNQLGIFSDPVKVSIANTSAIQSDKGQRPVKVMVYLSKAAAEPVAVKYSTRNGSAKAGVDYVATNGSVSFQPGEVAKWISVPIIGEVAAGPDENAPVNNFADFIVDLSQATGAILDMAHAYITIMQNLSRNPSIAAGSQGAQAVYEVIISFTGYLTLYGDNLEECGIRKDGTVVLSGLLSGEENVNSDDDITYTGDLEMIIDVDVCSVHRLPGESEDRWCGIRVNGSGKVFTELELIFSDEAHKSEARGGYIKIENKDGQFRRTVTGECGEQNDEEWVMVPNKSISSVFNGAELPKLTTRTLRRGIYVDIDEKSGNRTVVEVLRKIQ